MLFAWMVYLACRCRPGLGSEVRLEEMRILAGADLHGSLDVYMWFLEEARRHGVEALVLAGDLFGFADEVDDPDEDQQINARHVRGLLMGIELPVYYIMGNDDSVELEPSDGKLIPLHGRRVECPPYNFVGYQYSLPWMGGIFEKPEEEIAADLAPLEDLLDSRTVFVTHSPAHGTLDPGKGPLKIGSRSLEDLLDRNNVLAHIHGHSHSGFGRDGYHFNVASALSKRAMMIDLETREDVVLQD